MSTLFYILTVTNLVAVVIIFFKIRSNNTKKAEEKLSKEYFLLKKEKDMPDIKNVDTDNTLLKNVLECSILEDWDIKVECERGGFAPAYTIELNNKSNTLYVRSRFRLRTADTKKKELTLYLGHFVVTDNLGNAASYGGDDCSVETKFIILDFLWNKVLLKNEEDYKKQLAYYNNVVEAIQNELKTLNRDKSIASIFQ